MRILYILLFFVVSLFSKEIFGEVFKLKGIAFANNKQLKECDKVFVGDTITTKKAMIIIKQESKNTIIIGKDSKIVLEKEDTIKQEKANVFFDIVKSANNNMQKYRFNVILKTATMGIRGTNFIVNNTSNKEEILLREGKIDISAKKEFKLYEKKLEDEFNEFKAEFESYKQEVDSEFMQYKQKQNYEFVKMVKEFSIQEGSSITLSGDGAYDKKLSKTEIKKRFSEFDSFLQNTNSSCKR